MSQETWSIVGIGLISGRGGAAEMPAWLRKRHVDRMTEETEIRLRKKRD